VLLGAPLAQRWQAWGLSAPAHFLTVAVLAGCALALLLGQPAYPWPCGGRMAWPCWRWH